jgi:hypothetical protein
MSSWKDISALLGMTEALSESYVKLISAMLVHQIAEQSLDKVDSKLIDGVCEIPNVGKIKIHRVGEELEYSFIPTDKFEESLKRAIRTGKSPLEKVVEGTLIDRLNKKYRGVV